MFWQLLFEIFLVSFFTAIIGTLLTYIGMGEKRNKFNEWPKIIFIFFLTGGLIHLLCEISGLNKLYCTRGNACLVR